MRLCQPTILDRLLDWAKRLWMSAPTEGALSPTSLLPPNRWLIEGTRSCSRHCRLLRAAAPDGCCQLQILPGRQGLTDSRREQPIAWPFSSEVPPSACSNAHAGSGAAASEYETV